MRNDMPYLVPDGAAEVQKTVDLSYWWRAVLAGHLQSTSDSPGNTRQLKIGINGRNAAN
ncbi:MAG: hypothetical protein ACYC1M_13170 [Armatimonadota bacterium]